MSDQTITSLIKKLEGAEVGSRELDMAVARVLSFGQGFATPYLTTSLDAALALAERVLPGWWWTTGRCGLTCHASVGPDSKFIGEPELSKFDSGFHADVPNPSTPALALCIAILRAQSEARATGEDSPANEGEGGR